MGLVLRKKSIEEQTDPQNIRLVFVTSKNAQGSFKSSLHIEVRLRVVTADGQNYSETKKNCQSSLQMNIKTY